MYHSFRELYDEVMGCTKCDLCKSRTNVVFGEGNPRADILFIGEGPGANEDRTGRPFVGAAGQLLSEMLTDIGLRREDVFIANVVKCRPNNNRDPRDDEIAQCIPYLRGQVAFIKPKIIVCLGRIAAGAVYKRSVSIFREHGRITRVKNFLLMPTFHPAALLYKPENKELAMNDFAELMRALEP